MDLVLRIVSDGTDRIHVGVSDKRRFDLSLLACHSPFHFYLLSFLLFRKKKATQFNAHIDRRFSP